TVLTGAVSYFGLVLSQANQRRIEAHAKIEQRRLESESAMKAAELVSTTDAKPADAATTGGALRALVMLGQAELAATMLWDLWNSKRVFNTTATAIVNALLRSAYRQAHSDAAMTLYLQAPQPSYSNRSWYDWPFDLDCRWN